MPANRDNDDNNNHIFRSAITTIADEENRR